MSLEALENRIVPNAYTVNVTTDAAVGQGGAGNGLIGDLRYCITQADKNAGSTISIQVVGAIQLTVALPAINGNIVNIVGNGKAAVSGSGNVNNLFSVFSIQQGATVDINQLTIENGYETGGGGILNNGNLTLSGVTIKNNTATQNGGGIDNGPSGDLWLVDATIENNTAEAGGGVYNSGIVQTCNQYGTNIISNTATGDGGGLYNVGTASFTGGGDTISNNTANPASGKG